MSKSLIQVTVYQIGNIVHNPPIIMGVPINRNTIISPVVHPAPYWTAMVGEDGQAPDVSIAPYVYGVIGVSTPSNSNITSYFVSQTVAAMIADIG